jgi:hypothetical protein
VENWLKTCFPLQPYRNLPFPVFINGKKQQKGKAIPFTFRPFLATFSIFYKWTKNSKKVKL